MRDWTSTLYPASYKGVAFFIELDALDAGRRIVAHEFPHSDQPFIEDMGDGVRVWRLSAYVASDAADAEAAALVAALSSKGPGTLVLPIDGPVQARAQRPWSRRRERDRAGYIAFDLTFIREGVNFGGASAAHLAQLAYVAVDALASSLPALLGSTRAANESNWVVEALVSNLQDAASAIEAVRVTTGVDPSASVSIGRDTATLFAEIPASVSSVTGADPALAPRIVDLARRLSAAIDPPSAMAAFAMAAELFPAPSQPVLAATPAAGVLQKNHAIAARLARLAFVAAFTDALLGATYASRSEAVVARRRLNDFIDAEIAFAVDSPNVDLLVALQDMRAAAAAWLHELTISLAPVVIVSTARALPATLLAYKLYGDPTRAGELVARSGAPHPSFMPIRFDALAA